MHPAAGRWRSSSKEWIGRWWVWTTHHLKPTRDSRLKCCCCFFWGLGGGIVATKPVWLAICPFSDKLRHSNGKCLGSIRTKASIYYISLSPSLSSALTGCPYIHIYIYHISIIYKHLDSQLIWLLLFGIFLLNHISSEWTFFKQRTSFWIPYEIPAVQNSI